MLQYDFEKSVGYWVCMTAHAFQRALNEELAPSGITYRQFQVLAWLALEGALSQADLADRMQIEPATLVSVLRRMQRDGLVRRSACTLDRRKRLVRPTRRAVPIWERGARCARRVRARATAGMAPADVERAIELLAAMGKNLAAQPALAEVSV